MAHEELPIPVNEPVPALNTGKSNSYAGSCGGQHGYNLVEIEGDLRVGDREQLLKVKTDNVTDARMRCLSEARPGEALPRGRDPFRVELRSDRR